MFVSKISLLFRLLEDLVAGVVVFLISSGTVVILSSSFVNSSVIVAVSAFTVVKMSSGDCEYDDVVD